MNIVTILRSRDMLDILKPFLSGYNLAHYTSKDDFLRDVKRAGTSSDELFSSVDLTEDLILIVNAGIEIDSDVLSLRNVKLIQQFGIGYENVDMGYASQAGVPVFNVPTVGTYNAVSVAELSIFFVLALARDYNGCVNSINHGVANEPMGYSISSKKFGVVGLGGVGLEIIRMLKIFNTEIYGLKRTKPEGDYTKDLNIKFVGTVDDDFKYILPLIDYLILAVPLDKNTKNLFNDEAVSLAKNGLSVINVGRAGLIDKDSLIRGLKSGKIKGAGLDVFWKEPVHISDEIFHFNVIATPHIGGATHKSITDIARICAKNINNWIDDGDLTNCVNKTSIKFN